MHQRMTNRILRAGASALTAQEWQSANLPDLAHARVSRASSARAICPASMWPAPAIPKPSPWCSKADAHFQGHGGGQHASRASAGGPRRTSMLRSPSVDLELAWPLPAPAPAKQVSSRCSSDRTRARPASARAHAAGRDRPAQSVRGLRPVIGHDRPTSSRQRRATIFADSVSGAHSAAASASSSAHCR